MQAELQKNLVEQILTLYGEDMTMLADETLRIPAEHYTNATHAARERDGWFLGQPHLAALTGELPNSGDYIAYDHAGIPIVIVRGPDGKIRAFENICRHRAAPVARNRGQDARVFRCPFHGWSYDATTGRLVSQPNACGGFDTVRAADDNGDHKTESARPDLALRSLLVAEQDGLVLVDPRPDAFEVNAGQWLSGLGAEIESQSYADYVPVCSRVDRWACNWKLLLDTFFESYHVFSLHRESLAPDYLGIASTAHAFGAHNRLVVPMHSILELSGKPRRDWQLMPHAVVQYFMAPNVILSHYHGVLAMTRFTPISVNETEVTQGLLTPGPVVSEHDRKAHEEGFAFAHRITAEEDYPESVRVHRSLASGRVDTTLIGRNELGVSLFHQAIARSMTDLDENI